MKKCELLIPAGGKKQFVSAVENGADAVYAVSYTHLIYFREWTLKLKIKMKTESERYA